MRFLFLVFIIVPLVEMLLLFEVAAQIGGLVTLALVVLTAVIGVQILKRQGLSTLLRANERVRSGQLPAQEIVEGMLLAAAGALLLTPGFITDSLGFIFLTGPLRRPLASRIIGAGLFKATAGGAGVQFRSYGRKPRGGRGGNVYEGEYVETEPEQLDESEKRRPS